MSRPQRSQELEIIDQGPPAYTDEEFNDCLLQLERIGRHIGSEGATLRAFRRVSPPPTSILDVGCGGGHFTARLANEFPSAKVIGIDRLQAAVDFAQRRHQHRFSNLEFRHVTADELCHLEEGQVDVITTTLVCHHMSDEEIIAFLGQAYRVARQAVILNDLHRHPVALAGFYILSRLLYRNRLIRADGLLSIRKAFRRSDWHDYLKAAELPQQDASLCWCWPFRWRLVLVRPT